MLPPLPPPHSEYPNSANFKLHYADLLDNTSLVILLKCEEAGGNWWRGRSDRLAGQSLLRPGGD